MNLLTGKYLTFLFLCTKGNSDLMAINRIRFVGKLFDEKIKMKIKNLSITKDEEKYSPFSKLLFKQDFSDIQFEIQNSIIFAHKILLSSKSENLKFKEVKIKEKTND